MSTIFDQLAVNDPVQHRDALSQQITEGLRDAFEPQLLALHYLNIRVSDGTTGAIDAVGSFTLRSSLPFINRFFARAGQDHRQIDIATIDPETVESAGISSLAVATAASVYLAITLTR